MRTCRLIRAGFALGVLTSPLPVRAQAPAPAPVQDAALAQTLRAEIDQLRKDFEARLAALEARLASAGGVPPAEVPGAATPGQPTAQVPAGAEGAGGPSGALPVYGNVSAASKIFNPDMAVIGNFIGVGGQNDVRREPALAMPSSVAIAGVLLVFCYLIVPSVGAMLYSDRIGKRLAIGWSMGTTVSALGVYLSLALDLPTGATIVCTFGLVLAIMAAARPILHPRRVAD